MTTDLYPWRLVRLLWVMIGAEGRHPRFDLDCGHLLGSRPQGRRDVVPGAGTKDQNRLRSRDQKGEVVIRRETVDIGGRTCVYALLTMHLGGGQTR